MALASIKGCFGDDALLIEGDRIAAAPGRFVTDIHQVAEWYNELAACASLENKIDLFVRIEQLVHGEFLQGCEDPIDVTDPWISRTRNLVGRWLSAVLMEHSQCLVAAHRHELAYRVMERVVQLDPGNKSGWTRLHELGTVVGRAPRDPSTNPRSSAARRQGKALSEFERICIARLNSLPPDAQKSFAALSILPGLFPGALALLVCKTPTRVLNSFVDASLLVRDTSGYVMKGPLQAFASRQLDASDRRLLLNRMSAFALRWIGKMHSGSQDRSFLPFLRREDAQPLLRVVLQWHITQPPTRHALTYLHSLAACRVIDLSHAVRYCLHASEYPKISVAYRLGAALVACQILMDSEQFNLAIELCRKLLASRELCSAAADIAHVHRNLAISLHHTEKHSDALIAAHSACTILGELNDSHFLADAIRFKAEVQAALKDYDGALDSLNDSETIYRKLRINGQGYAECLYQIGVVYRALGRNDGAVEKWLHALALRQERCDYHGIADCVRQLSQIEVEEGRLAEARAHADYALMLYDKVGAGAGRTLALAALADVYTAYGRTTEARSIHCDARQFWVDRKHCRWVAWFDDKLIALPDEQATE